MEPESSLAYSQVPATCPYPEPTPSNPHNPSHFLKIHLILYSHLHLGLPNGLFPSGFPTRTLYTPLPPIRTTCPVHLILLDFTTRTIFGKGYISLTFSLCNFLHSPVTSSLSDPNTLLNTLFSNTLSLRSSLNVSDQVSHPYRTTGNIIVLYILTPSQAIPMCNTPWRQAWLFFLDCPTLTMDTILSFKMLQTTCQTARHPMPDDPNLQQHRQNLKYVDYIYSPEDTKDNTPSVCFWASCVGLCDEACLRRLTLLPHCQGLLALMKLG